jgi:hypothetical protein
MLMSGTRTSELDQTIMPLVQQKRWRAMDMFIFLHTRIGLLAARDDFTTSNFYNMFVDLADMSYYLNYGRMTPEIISKVKDLGNSFAEKFKANMSDKHYVFKFHALCAHFYRVVKAFGSAMNYDAFCLEFMAGEMKRMSSARVNQMVHLVLNFLLKFHNNFDQYKQYFGRKTIEFFRKTGLNVMDAPRLSIHTITPTKGRDTGLCTSEDLELLRQTPGLQKYANEIDKKTARRVLKIRFGAQCLTSTSFGHRGNTNDSFVQVEGLHFGVIRNLYELNLPSSPEPLFACELQAYKPVRLDDELGIPIRFPVNQVPRVATDDTYLVHLKAGLFVQKAVVCDFNFSRDSGQNFRPLKLYSIFPSEYSVR